MLELFAWSLVLRSLVPNNISPKPPVKAPDINGVRVYV